MFCTSADTYHLIGCLSSTKAYIQRAEISRQFSHDFLINVARMTDICLHAVTDAGGSLQGVGTFR